MKNFKRQKGITLIALVITIIIMLILVAVTVNYGIKSGLVSKTKNGTADYKFKEEEDEIGAIRLEYLADEKAGKVASGESLEAYLRRTLEEKATISVEDGEITILYNRSNKISYNKCRRKRYSRSNF